MTVYDQRALVVLKFFVGTTGLGTLNCPQGRKQLSNAIVRRSLQRDDDLITIVLRVTDIIEINHT